MINFATGILSGLIASIILLLCTRVWTKLGRPYIEELLYRDVRIDGRWKGTYYAPNAVEEVVSIRQTAHRVWGTISVVTGPDVGLTYDFDGTFKNLILTGEYSGKSRLSLDRGAFTFRLSNNGRILDGQYALYQDDDGEIHPAKCVWERSDA
jgi:hypothetical protein